MEQDNENKVREQNNLEKYIKYQNKMNLPEKYLSLALLAKPLPKWESYIWGSGGPQEKGGPDLRTDCQKQPSTCFHQLNLVHSQYLSKAALGWP